MRSRTRTPKRAAPADPRDLGPAADRLTALLERDAARAERSPAWRAESRPDAWPAAVDNFVFAP